MAQEQGHLRQPTLLAAQGLRAQGATRVPARGQHSYAFYGYWNISLRERIGQLLQGDRTFLQRSGQVVVRQPCGQVKVRQHQARAAAA